MQTERCVILLTGKSFEQLKSCHESERVELARLLNDLGSGLWLKGKLHVFEDLTYWKNESLKTTFCSCKLKQGRYAIWELANSFDLFGYTSAVPSDTADLSGFLRPHVVLHRLGSFPGIPGHHMTIGNLEFEPMEESCDLLERLENSRGTDQIRYNEELYILPENLILDVLDGRQRGLPIHLTSDQAYVLNLRGPILMSGEAGSGKTAVIITWLLNNLASGVEKQLFVTFSDRLTEVAERAFEGMLPAKMRSRSHGVRFLTYRELLLDISERGEIGHRFEPEREMTFDRFCQEYSKHIKAGVDPILVWDEIRSVIKGGCLEPERVLIDRKHYEKLNEERGQCKVPDTLREKYYEEASRYQRYLEREGLWDALDLARACLGKVVYSEKYDRIACDEVQDLAPCEIRLLLELTTEKDVSGMFFTGDMAQVINPSGFRWSTLKGLLWELSGRRDIMDVHTLKRNFRSTKQIVELANRVSGIREEMLGSSADRVHQVSRVTGDRPMYLRGSPIPMLKQCKNVRSDLRMIIVKNTEEKRRLMRELGEDAHHRAPILTVDESKGLERDGILLWKFFIPRSEISRDYWSNVFIPKKRASFRDLVEQRKKLPYELEYEFNLLHVGLTRAMNHLFIYDGDETANLLGMGISSDTVKIISETDERTLRMIWETEPPSAETLEDTAKELRTRNRELSSSYFRQAAISYIQATKYSEAARCYREAGDYENAASCYGKASDEVSRLECLALHFKSNSQWKESAEQWKKRGYILEKMGEQEKAFLSFGYAQDMVSKAGLLDEQARISEDKARCALESEEGKLIFKGLEALDDSITFWERKKRTDECLRLTNLAIREAQKVDKQHIEGLIRGIGIEEWIPQLHMRRAQFEATLGNTKVAAEIAMGASRLWRNLDPEKPAKYWKDCMKAMEKAAEWYYQSGDRDTAVKVRKQLTRFARSYSKPPEARPLWRKLIMLLLEGNRTDEAMEEVENLASYLVENRLEAKAVEELEIHEKWCIEHSLGTLRVRTLRLKARIYFEAGENYESALVQEKIGSLLEDMGQLSEATESYDRAASLFLRSGWTDRSVESFRKAMSCLERHRSPVEAGRYSLDSVILSRLLPGGHSEHALRWTSTAAEAFSTDLNSATGYARKAIARLNREIKGLARTREKTDDFGAREVIDSKIKEARDKIGWVWFTIGRAYDCAFEKGAKSRKLLKERDRFYDEAIHAFGETDNLDMLKRVESAKGGLVTRESNKSD